MGTRETVMKMIRCGSLRSWTRFKECRALDPSEYVDWQEGGGAVAPKLVFVSHRWITTEHPDPDGNQLRELQRRLGDLVGQDAGFANAIIFYDYSSMLQRPRTVDEDRVFYRDIGRLRELSRAADKVVILSEGYSDYKNRGWCFFEAIVSEDNVHFFDDQGHIKDDLSFLTSLLTEKIQQGTSYDLSYKLKAEEAEVVVAICQHLQGCRVTHAEDAPLIKQQVIAHFNSRRLTSCSRLVTALCKYFDVEFAMLPSRGDESTVYKPFFQESGWSRLPSLGPPDFLSGLMGLRQSLSLFALPAEVYENLGRRQTGGFTPVLRLSMPGVDNHQEFLEGFRNPALQPTPRDRCGPSEARGRARLSLIVVAPREARRI
jgi:hypothetical protein